MIKKNYRMNEEDLEVIQQVKKQHGFHSDSETLRYIVRSHIVQNQEENCRRMMNSVFILSVKPVRSNKICRIAA